ncbi:MAG: PEPxxWA-CTERM sorting domain-containing protein [Polymorphobacter sp.]
MTGRFARLAAAALVLGTALTPARATVVTMQMSGFFRAIPNLGFGNNPFSAVLTYDLDALSYTNIISPTFSNVHYGSQTPDGPALGTGTFSLTSDYFSFTTQRVFVNYTRETQCSPLNIVGGCAQFQMTMGSANDSYATRLTFTTTDIATFSGPFLPGVAPSSTSVTYAELYVRNPLGDRIAFIGREQIEPNAPFSQLAFGPAAGGVPEPASWALLITGFGLTGGVMRRRRAATFRPVTA